MKTASALKTASVRSLVNIGSVTEKKLNAIGILSKEDFLSRDPYELFEELRQKVDPTLCRCALASIVGAKLGLPWHRITKVSAGEYEKRHPGHVWGKC
ncbi:MAG: TfoX/Sxy family DNA transformation protein [Candidatus Aminicenantes bacterium]|nr:TfoX/Sxy family DNA transformation protein [Candidatus Aminicenantes bacterium]